MMYMYLNNINVFEIITWFINEAFLRKNRV